MGTLGAQDLSSARQDLGRAGELVAARFLSGQGLEVVAGNVEVPGGEIDLLAMDGRIKVAVEVRATRLSQDPIDAVDERKRLRVQRLARDVGADRVDFVGVGFDSEGVDVHWLPGA